MESLKKGIVTGLICIVLMLVINFILPRFMPGDPVLMLMGGDSGDVLTSDNYQQLRDKFGLDLPIGVQFANYMRALLKGDIGYSYNYSQPVSQMIAAHLPVTLQLAIPSILLSSLLSLSLGMYMGYRRDGRLDKLVSFSMTILNAIPPFLLGMIFLSVFSFHLQLLPLGGLNSLRAPRDGWGFVLDRVRHLILPVLTITAGGLPAKYLMVRNMVHTAKDEKYVIFSKARGLSESRILFVHVLKNICPPFITLVGLNIGLMVAGSMLIEIIFSINGMGTLIYRAITVRDFPVLQGCLFFLSIFVVVANLATDAINALIDPRQRHGVKQ